MIRDVQGTDCIGSYQFNYHTITTTASPKIAYNRNGNTGSCAISTLVGHFSPEVTKSRDRKRPCPALLFSPYFFCPYFFFRTFCFPYFFSPYFFPYFFHVFPTVVFPRTSPPYIFPVFISRTFFYVLFFPYFFNVLFFSYFFPRTFFLVVVAHNAGWGVLYDVLVL